MKSTHWLNLLLLASAAVAGAAVPGGGMEWPTLHGNLQRWGFYPDFPTGPLKIVWRKELWSELTGPRAEVIVGGGLAFMGTYAGNLYAWDANSGEEKWVFKTGGAVGHSPMFFEGLVFFGSMDRKVHAIEARSGKEKWHFEAGEGVWTSPAVFHGLVLFGARDGIFYALDAASGQLTWKFQTGDRILTSASISEDGERVLFASDDMHVYCLAVKDGALLWKSRKPRA